ncbi:hypothetical protein MMC29_006621 [Sticta canariensis]|nr:hypothetical protein [Sticta canariensis]
MAAPDDQNMNDVTSEDERMADEEASGPNEEAPEDHPTANEEVSNADGVEPENHSATNQVSLVSPSATPILSTSNRLGLLSVPPEVRILIYRHLLVEENPLSTYWIGSYDPFPAILNTSSLIRQEAFQVFYGENTFYIGNVHPGFSILNNQQIRNTILNVRFIFRLNDPSPNRARTNFINLIEAFGSPAIVRRTLTIIIRVGPFYNHLFDWLNRGLPRFTNFRNVIFRYVPDSSHLCAKGFCPIVCQLHEQILPPVFGPGSSQGVRRRLVFHPQRYLNSLPPGVDVDWMDYLDGIRLTWDQDPPSDANDPEA